MHVNLLDLTIFKWKCWRPLFPKLFRGFSLLKLRLLNSKVQILELVTVKVGPSLHVDLDLRSIQDRSQFAFERSHSGRFGLRSIWDRSNSLVWMTPYSIGTWTSWSLGKLENSFQETLVLRALVNPKLALVVSLWKHGNVFFFNHYFLNNNVRSARNLSIQNNSLQCFCITYNLSQLSVEEGQSYNL